MRSIANVSIVTSCLVVSITEFPHAAELVTRLERNRAAYVDENSTARRNEEPAPECRVRTQVVVERKALLPERFWKHEPGDFEQFVRSCRTLRRNASVPRCMCTNLLLDKNGSTETSRNLTGIPIPRWCWPCAGWPKGSYRWRIPPVHHGPFSRTAPQCLVQHYE